MKHDQADCSDHEMQHRHIGRQLDCRHNDTKDQGEKKGYDPQKLKIPPKTNDCDEAYQEHDRIDGVQDQRRIRDPVYSVFKRERPVWEIVDGKNNDFDRDCADEERMLNLTFQDIDVGQLQNVECKGDACDVDREVWQCERKENAIVADDFYIANHPRRDDLEGRWQEVVDEQHKESPVTAQGYHLLAEKADEDQ